MGFLFVCVTLCFTHRNLMCKACGQSLTGSSQRGGQLFTLAPTINLESPVNLASMSLDCWGKLDYLERTHELKVIGDSCLTSSYTWIILTLLLTHSYFLYLQIQWSQ